MIKLLSFIEKYYFLSKDVRKNSKKIKIFKWGCSSYPELFLFCIGSSMNSMKLVILLHFISWKKKIIFWYQQEVYFTKYIIFGKMHFLLISENAFCYEMKCNGMTSFMEFMIVHMDWDFVYFRTVLCDVTHSRQKRSKMIQGWITSLQKETKQCCDVIMK